MQRQRIFISPRKYSGLPIIRLMCSNGCRKFRKYNKEEVDFFIAYNLFNDTAYIFPYKDVEKKSCVAVSDKYAEKWNFLLAGEIKEV